ncbi:MAG: hypothetical protein LBC52_02525 [Treponema sp.]|jgi:hypothetical protein|nr:hypothetical protein [Treponema sp.]
MTVKTVKRFFFIAIIAAVFMTVSCRQIGGKIFFQDDEWTQMREDARKKNDDGSGWNAMLDEWDRKWTVNGLRVYMDIFARHTVFSSKEPYYIRFSLEPPPDLQYADNNYVRFTIKDVKINGESGKDYQAIADTLFPVTRRFDKLYMSTSGFNTGSVFPFSFEKLVIVFTVEVETSDSVESKTFERHLSPRDNPPVPFTIWA